MRISNAPTVVSNAIAGLVLGGVAAGPDAPIVPIDRHAIVILAPLLCYLGGMVLNDAFDAAVDARERPERPIPSGRVSRAAAFLVGPLLLLGGIACAALSGSIVTAGATAILALLVVAYDALHKLTAASVVLLAICRALAAIIPMTVFASDLGTVASSGILVHPAILALWTLLLSILARGEVAAAHVGLPSCTACGHAMLAGATVCSECGKRPNPAIPETRALQRQLACGTLLVFTAAAVVAALLWFLPRGDMTFANATPVKDALHLGIGGIALAFVLVSAEHRHSVGRLSTPRFVGLLIALLAAIDALALTAVGQPLALACLGCCIATIVLQRRIAGS